MPIASLATPHTVILSEAEGSIIQQVSMPALRKS